MADDSKRPLRRFQRRLLPEAAVRSVCDGLVMGLSAACLTECVIRLTGRHVLLAPMIAAFLPVFVLTSLLRYGLVHRPSDAGTADRMDEAYRLQDRVATMVALQGKQDTLSVLQRRDTFALIRTLDPKDMPLRFPRREMLLCVGLLLLSVFISIPSSWFPGAPSPLQAEESEEARLAREMLENARRRILASDLSDDEKTRMLSELDAAASDLDEDVSLEELADIMRVSGELEDSLEGLAYTISWLHYMAESPLFRDVCLAVTDEDKEMMHLALEAMEDRLRMPDGEDRIFAIMEYANAIDVTLEMHEPLDEESDVAVAFFDFSENLKSTTGYVFGKSRSDERIHMAFANFEQELRRTLAGVSLWREAEEAEETIYLQAEDSNPLPGEGSADSEASLDAQQKLLYTDDPDAARGAGTGIRDRQHHADTETIYEPTLDPRQDVYDPMRWRSLQDDTSQSDDGHVAYGSVYGVYYAELLRRLEEGSVPDDLVEAVENYFFGL